MQKVDQQIADKKLFDLFQGFHWNTIPETILEGSMGEVYVNNAKSPSVGMATIPELKVVFLGGDSSNIEIHDFIKELPILSMIMFASEGWPDILKSIHPKKWIVMPRFGFTAENLNIDTLLELSSHISDEYQIKKIDLVLAERVMAMAKDKDKLMMEQLFGFASPKDFMERGLGYIAFLGDEMVSIAAAGAASKKGIEVQINTRKEYEGQGLGTAVAAALLIDCLKNEICPNWDAATEISAGLAKKLGYTPKGEYLVYVYTKFKFLVHLRTFLRKIRGKGIIEP